MSNESSQALSANNFRILSKKNIQLQVQIQGNNLQVQFTGLPNNNPSANSNSLALWQTEEPDFVTAAAQNPTFPANYTQPSGGFGFSATVTGQAWVLGYLVGGLLGTNQQAYGNTAATVLIPQDNKDGGVYTNQYEMDLSLAYIGWTSLTVNYNFAGLWSASMNGAWAAIFQGPQASYTAAPLVAQQVTDPLSVIFNNFALGRGLVYTVAMFNSGWSSDSTKRIQTTMSSTLTFQVVQGLSAHELAEGENFKGGEHPGHHKH